MESLPKPSLAPIRSGPRASMWSQEPTLAPRGCLMWAARTGCQQKLRDRLFLKRWVRCLASQGAPGSFQRSNLFSRGSAFQPEQPVPRAMPAAGAEQRLNGQKWASLQPGAMGSQRASKYRLDSLKWVFECSSVQGSRMKSLHRLGINVLISPGWNEVFPYWKLAISLHQEAIVPC